jgi:thioredoxin 1
MANMVEVGKDNFEEKVLKSELPVVADFSAEWCMPCRKLAPILEELAGDYAGRAVIAHIDVDRESSLARQYQVMSVPTLLFFKNGKIVSSSIGLVSKRNLAEALDEVIGSAKGG